MHDDAPQQPVLTSHLRPAGPQRGKQRYDVDNVRRQPEFPRDRPDRNDRNPRKPGFRPHTQAKAPKPAGFCHDQLLQAFKGAKLTLTLISGGEIDVTLVDGDRYSLVVESEFGREVIFKSALAGILLPGTPKAKAN